MLPWRRSKADSLDDRRLAKRARAGDASAMYQLGRQSERDDVDTAMSWYRLAASGGHGDAMYQLSRLLYKALRLTEAEQMLRQAAEAGNKVAMHDLGVLAERNHRPDRAKEWFELAAAAGHQLAEGSLRRLEPQLAEWHKKSVPERERWRVAAESGDPEAMVRYAHAPGMGDDPDEAMSWLRRAAETGYTPAMNEIARRCRPANRFGDYEQTEHWWRRSALAGDREGMTELAKFHRARGNTAEAMHWFRIRAEHGNPADLVEVGDMYQAAGADSEAEACYRQAAEQGSVEGMSTLGERLLLRDDLDEAERWLRQAAPQGHGELFLARVLARRGQFSEAEEIVRDLAETADNEWAMIDLGLLLEWRGELAEAQTWYEMSMVDGDYPHLLARRVEAKRRGDDQAAAEFDRRARAARPPSALRFTGD